MQMKEVRGFEYIASDGKIFKDAKLCKQYEEYLKADKVWLVEAVKRPTVADKKPYPVLLWVCASLKIANRKLRLANKKPYLNISIIERLVEK